MHLFFLLLAAFADPAPAADAPHAAVYNVVNNQQLLPNEHAGEAGTPTVNIDAELGDTLILSSQGAVSGDKPRSIRWEVDPPSAIKRKSRDVDGLWVLTLNTGLVARDIVVIQTVALGDESDSLRVVVHCGKGAQPPPVVPHVEPGPDGPQALRVLMVYESSNTTLPSAQQSILTSGRVREYLRQHCPVEGSTGNYGFRVFDKDLDVAGQPKIWQDAMKQPRDSLPWIIVMDLNGKNLASAPLPKDVDATLALLRKYGGD